MFALNQRKKSKSAFLPFRQKSYRAEIKLIGGHFARRTCCFRSRTRSSSKTSISRFSRGGPANLFLKFHRKNFLSVEKSNVGNRLKRVWPSFTPIGAMFGGKRPFEILTRIGAGPSVRLFCPSIRLMIFFLRRAGRYSIENLHLN